MTLTIEIIIKYQDKEVMLTEVGHLGELSNKKGLILLRKFQLIQTKPKNEKVIVEKSIG